MDRTLKFLLTWRKCLITIVVGANVVIAIVLYSYYRAEHSLIEQLRLFRRQFPADWRRMCPFVAFPQVNRFDDILHNLGESVIVYVLFIVILLVGIMIGRAFQKRIYKRSKSAKTLLDRIRSRFQVPDCRCGPSERWSVRSMALSTWRKYRPAIKYGAIVTIIVPFVVLVSHVRLETIQWRAGAEQRRLNEIARRGGKFRGSGESSAESRWRPGNTGRRIARTPDYVESPFSILDRLDVGWSLMVGWIVYVILLLLGAMISWAWRTCTSVCVAKKRSKNSKSDDDPGSSSNQLESIEVKTTQLKTIPLPPHILHHRPRIMVDKQSQTS